MSGRLDYLKRSLHTNILSPTLDSWLGAQFDFHFFDIGWKGKGNVWKMRYEEFSLTSNFLILSIGKILRYEAIQIAFSVDKRDL